MIKTHGIDLRVASIGKEQESLHTMWSVLICLPSIFARNGKPAAAQDTPSLCGGRP